MIPFLTEIVQLLVASIPLLAMAAVLKKSEFVTEGSGLSMQPAESNGVNAERFDYAPDWRQL